MGWFPLMNSIAFDQAYERMTTKIVKNDLKDHLENIKQLLRSDPNSDTFLLI